MPDTTVVESTMILRVVRHLERHDVDPSAILEAEGFTRDDAGDRELLIPLGRAMAVYQRAADALDDPALGLSIASEASPRDYGLVGLIWQHHPTLDQAFDALAHFYTAFLSEAEIAVDRTDDEVRICSHFEHDHPGLDLLRQETVAAIFKHARAASPDAWSPRRVTYRQVPEDPAPFHAFFGTDQVVFGAGADCIVLDRERLARPTPGADPVVLSHLLEAAETHLARRREASGAQSKMLRLQGCTIDFQTGTVRRGNEVIPLTTRERSLLEYFSKHANHTVTHEALERDIWQLGKTVISHAPAVAIRRLRQKIEPEDQKKPVNLVTVFGEGWKLVVPEQSTP